MQLLRLWIKALCKNSNPKGARDYMSKMSKIAPKG